MVRSTGNANTVFYAGYFSSSAKVKKVTWSPCESWRHTGSAEIAPLISNLGTRWKWLASIPGRLTQGTTLKPVGHDSIVDITTRYGLDCSGNESRCEPHFSAPIQTGSGVHPASYRMNTKYSGRGYGDKHPPPSNAEVKGRVELDYLLPIWVIMAYSRVNFTFYFYSLKSKLGGPQTGKISCPTGNRKTFLPLTRLLPSH